MRCVRGFCLGMRNGEHVGLALAPAPAVSLAAEVVRGEAERRTDLTVVAAADDMALGWPGTMRGFVLFRGFCVFVLEGF